MLHDFLSRFTATGCDRRRRREASGRAEEEGASMAFTLYSLLQTAILCTNAVAVLHEERFLSKSESGMFDSSRCLDTCGRARLIWPRGAPEMLAAADWMHHISWFYCVSRTMKLIKGDVKGTKGPVSSCLFCLLFCLFCSRLGGGSGSRGLRRWSRSQSPDSPSHPLSSDRHERLESFWCSWNGVKVLLEQLSGVEMMPSFSDSKVWLHSNPVWSDLINLLHLKSILKSIFSSCSSVDNCELGLYRPAVGVWVTTGRWNQANDHKCQGAEPSSWQQNPRMINPRMLTTVSRSSASQKRNKIRMLVIHR